MKLEKQISRLTLHLPVRLKYPKPFTADFFLLWPRNQVSFSLSLHPLQVYTLYTLLASNLSVE